MDLIQQALQKYIGGNKPVSPIPQENVLDTSSKINTYKTTQEQLNQLQAFNPNLKLNRDQFLNQGMQQGGFTPALINNIAYQGGMDQNAKMPLVTPAPTVTPTATPVPNPIAQIGGNITTAVQGAISSLRNLGQAQAQPLTDAQIFQQHGISPKAGLSILQAEGGRIGNNNPGNINATDANPQGAYNYPTHQAGVAAAAATMANLAKKGGYTGNDPVKQLKAIEKAGYAGDPSTWQQRSASQGGAGKTFKHWSDFVRATAAWNNN